MASVMDSTSFKAMLHKNWFWWERCRKHVESMWEIFWGWTEIHSRIFSSKLSNITTQGVPELRESSLLYLPSVSISRKLCRVVAEWTPRLRLVQWVEQHFFTAGSCVTDWIWLGGSALTFQEDHLAHKKNHAFEIRHHSTAGTTTAAARANGY